MSKKLTKADLILAVALCVAAVGAFLAIQFAKLVPVEGVTAGSEPPGKQSAPNPGDATRTNEQLEKQFSSQVRPFLENYCLGCHSGKKPKGDFDLSPFTAALAKGKNLPQWDLMLERLQAQEMPPKDASRMPSADERSQTIAWILAMQEHEAAKHAGDPGIVLARRLSNAEFDYTIRDLTGVDIRPTKEFPVDPANEAGFDNSGESLAMSPALMKKYLAAARLVADHLVLKPNGFVFAPHPAVTDTRRRHSNDEWRQRRALRG
jgi:hypothetical protein